MTRSASPAVPGSEFHDFLFATIGEERNGMALSVLSAFARRDVDPWLEAANLARMPKEIATERVASLIAALPDKPPTPSDSKAVAVRLVALLPRQDNSKPPPAKASHGVGLTADHRVLVFLILMAFLLSTQFMMRNARPPTPAADAHGAAASVSSTP